MKDHLLIDLIRGGEIDYRDTHRAALAISAEFVLIARAEVNVWGNACTCGLRYNQRTHVDI